MAHITRSHSYLQLAFGSDGRLSLGQEMPISMFWKDKDWYVVGILFESPSRNRITFKDAQTWADTTKVIEVDIRPSTVGGDMWQVGGVYTLKDGKEVASTVCPYIQVLHKRYP
jgi:hypothetical protein